MLKGGGERGLRPQAKWWKGLAREVFWGFLLVIYDQDESARIIIYVVKLNKIIKNYGRL